jgi:outer membrane lipoprotein-sorting protein
VRAGCFFRHTGLFILLNCISLGVVLASPAPSADQIVKEVEKKLHSKDEVATVKMVIVEASGASKERKLQVSRRVDGDDQAVLVKLESPADLRGTGLLSVVKGKDSEQWLYLPSSKQTRRILSNKRQANFLDSELSYEDLGGTNGGFTNKVLRTEKDSSGAPVSVIESDTSNPDASYSKVLTWVPMKTYLANKVEYYDHAGGLLKVMEMQNYKQFKSGVWRAELVTVKNVQNNRSTRLELSDLKLDQGLSASHFSPSALENP